MMKSISEKYKVLNLYAGIGGNRKHWDNCQVTAVELNPEIAAIYQDFYPDDKVIIGDAHQYLLEHFKEFDFIWSSPPCQSHSGVNYFLNAQGIIRYPDMSLYQEIIFLQHFYKGKYVIENVKPYYEPLIKPQISGRHYFWSNIKIPNIKIKSSIGRMAKARNGGPRTQGRNHYKLGFDLSKYKGVNKENLLNNCVHPDIGLSIFNRARNIQIEENTPQGKLF